MTIPASDIVAVNPSVIGAGGSALALNGVLLTQNAAVPIGTVQQFTTASAVGSFFGLTSQEYLWAATYFQGENNATSTPATLYFVQYPEVSVAAYLRSGSMSAMTLAQLQALSGTIILTVNGTVETSSSISLASATSFSNAATIIQAGFVTPNFTVTYDTQRQAFLFTSSTTGASSTITFATGTLSAGLFLTQATGAVLSQGAIAASPTTFMSSVTAVNLNWATFSTIWHASTAEIEGFSQWNSAQSNRFMYVPWDNNAAALTVPDTTSALAVAIAANYGGTMGIYCDPVADANGYAAAMAMGIAASFDFNRTNARQTMDFKYTNGVPVSVTSQANASALRTNGYNFVGQWANATTTFTGMNPGQITGAYKFADEYLNQVYLNSQLQGALLTLLFSVPSIPYNSAGQAMISAACQDPINQALKYGSIVPGVALSALQIAEVNAAAGMQIDNILSTRGWYLQVGTPSAQVRAARGTPPITLWYMDGGAVQSITVASVLVQ